jgi:hypothetical protein
VNEAVRAGWLLQTALEDILEHNKGRPGIKALHPIPDLNAQVEGFEVDIHFPGTNLIVELDSYVYHRTPDGVAQTVRQLLERQLELARRCEGLALVEAGHADAE